MSSKQFTKASLFGFLIWFIPLVFSFAFYNQERELQIDYDLFKTMMVIILAAVAIPLTVKYFLPLKTGLLKQGVFVGFWWLAINLALDVVVLMPMLGVTFDQYMAEIGLRYFTIPITTIGIGYLLQHRGKNKK